MSTKEAIERYFQMRKDVADEGLDFLFKTPVTNENDNSIIYEGAVDEDEYISWKPVKMTVSIDFKSLEEELKQSFIAQ